jgi:sugar lactone lactonase YvrE
MRVLPSMIVLAIGGAVANGNPIPSDMADLKLVGEKVVISVGQSESLVDGDYTFQVTNIHLYGRTHGHAFAAIRFDMPVILPSVIEDSTGEGAQLPMRDNAHRWSDIAKLAASMEPWGMMMPSFPIKTRADQHDILKAELQLPKGWEYVLFPVSGSTSAREVNQTFKMHVSYTQPHLPGNLSAYLPILPDDIVKTNFIITFRAQQRTHFTPPSGYDVVGKPTDTSFSVRPVNLQLIQLPVVQIPRYTITVTNSADGGGTAEGGGTYYNWQTVKISAKRVPGHSFVNWTENDSIFTNVACFSITATTDRTFVANFSRVNPTNALIYASIPNTGEIEKFDANGNGSVFASGLRRPEALACDKSGNLYVAVAGGVIEKFDPNGKGTVFASGLFPSALACDKSGDLYALLGVDGTIEKFDASGNRSVFATGLSRSGALAIDDSGNVYVTIIGISVDGGTIEQFRPDGQHSEFFSGLSSPSALAFDNAGYLYVAVNPSKIWRIDSNGMGSVFATLDGANVTGLAIDNSGDLYAPLTAGTGMAGVSPPPFYPAIE